MNPKGKKALQVFTIGHSNRSFEEFLSLLERFGIRAVSDVRRYPRSGKFPHFNRQILQRSLGEHGIKYVWLEALGGRRITKTNAASPNIGLRSPGFRSYADHMATDAFRKAAGELKSTSATSRTVIMCAEKLYWKCHRRFLSDYLTAKGVEIKHILDTDRIIEHKLTAGAIITKGGSIEYPSTMLYKSDATLFEP